MTSRSHDSGAGRPERGFGRGGPARPRWLGIDLGTASVKVLLLDGDGTALASARRPYAVASPRPGWAETDPEVWWSATVEATRACLQSAGTGEVQGNAGLVRGIGLSGNMHGVVLTDAAGRALRPAVLWADTRSAREVSSYARLPKGLRLRLANPAVVGMAGPTLLWLRRHESAVFGAARWALQPKDWLRFRLTGVAASDPSDASATLLYDLIDDRWSEATLGALGLRPSLFPALVPSSSVAGGLAERVAAELGLPAGVPVAAGGADTACALFASDLGPGEIQVTVGSGLQVVAPLAAPTPDPSLRTHLYRTVGDGWYAMAAVQNAGLALEWVRGVLELSWEAFYEEAFRAAPGQSGLTFLPYLTGERTPHLDPHARGAWTGLGLHHRRSDLAQAAFEGVAFAFADALAAVTERGIGSERLRLAGGGSVRPEWRQLLADVSGSVLVSADVPDASAVGAARLAALALGTPIARTEHAGRTIQPRPAPALLEAYQRYRAAYERSEPHAR